MDKSNKLMKSRLSRMRQRCYNSNNPQYLHSGGRGITVCDRWLDTVNGLANFIEDMGYPPSEDATLMRRNQDGNYTKDNMYWLQNTPERIREQNRLHQMRGRCYNPKHHQYQYYGGRGVRICERWLDPDHGVDNFMADMGPWPGPGYTIDRIYNNGNYCKENCRWATYDEQTDNRRKNNIRYYDIDGKQLSSREICEIVGDGCTPDVIAARYYKGRRGKDLLKPVRVAPKYPTPHGPMTVGEIAKLTGRPRHNIDNRLKNHPTISWDELTKPTKPCGGSVGETFDTMRGALTKAQIVKIGGIAVTTVTPRLAKGMVGTDLFLTRHQDVSVYIKHYGYMNNSEYLVATRYRRSVEISKRRRELSHTQGWLTLNSKATHVLTDGTSITTKELLSRTQLKPELLAWLVVRYEIPVEVLWYHGPILDHQIDQFVAKHTTGNLVSLVNAPGFLQLLDVQLLRRGIDLYSLPSRESDVHAMMERIGISTKRYVLISIHTTDRGEVVVVDTPDLIVLEKPSDNIVGSVEMVYGGQVRVHIPDTDTTEHQFIMSPTTGVGLVKQPDGTFDIKEY